MGNSSTDRNRAPSAQREKNADAPTLFSDVLCAVDGHEESLEAVEQAASLTGSDGRVTLLTVTSYRSPGDRGAAIGPQRAKEILDRAVRILDEAGVSYSVEVDPAAPPAEVILEWMLGRDLLAIGAPSSSLLSGMFIKGVGETALDAFTTPLLIARPSDPSDGFAQRILVASDGLEGSDELVEMAGRLARAKGADLTLFHASDTAAKTHPHRIEMQFEKLQSETDRVIDVRVEPGGAHTTIVESAAEIDASLVVMGSRGRHGLRALGSVGRRVAHHGHCSVLLVPPVSRRSAADGRSPRPVAC
jgi:nucleotide-binding universal stress UspA family protein